MGAVLEVVDVSLAGQDGRLTGGHLDAPKAGRRVEAHGLAVIGWALGRDVPVVGVELIHEGTVIRRAPLGEHRPDLAEAFPDAPGAARAGFRTTVPIVGTAAAVDLHVQAVLADRTRTPLAVVHARRGWRTAPLQDLTGALVSVVIPCYNQAHFLPEALDSVLAQTHPQLEVVVVDDGSTDNTSAVAAGYPGVRCIRQPNRGLAAARNTGLRHTTGEYLIFLDADDRLLPHALTTGLRELTDHPDAAFAAGRWVLVDHVGLPLPMGQSDPIRNDHYAELLRMCFISAPASVIYRRWVFDVVGDFDSNVDASADYDLYLRVARQYEIRTHTAVVCEYRAHAANMNSDAALMLRAELAVLRGQRRFAKLDQAHLSAFHDGLRRARGYHGPRVMTAASDAARRGEWRRAVALSSLLLRENPQYWEPAGRAVRRAREVMGHVLSPGRRPTAAPTLDRSCSRRSTAPPAEQ